MDKRGERIVGGILRFIPGAIFGALFGLYVVVRTDVNTPLVFFGGIAVSAVTFGSLSARLGMRFWEGWFKDPWTLV